MMTSSEMEQVLRNVDVRTSTIEQILPTLATKADLERFATKDDLRRFATKDDLKRFATKDDQKRFATKDDLKRFATKDDQKRFATKDDLKRFATKDDLKRFATKDDLAGAVEMLRREIEDSRRYALMLHEDVKADIRMLAEHLAHIIERLDRRP